MWNWVAVAAGIYILFIIMEESVYYLWNRYVYGPKERKARPRQRIILGMAFIIQLYLIGIRHKLTHKVSSSKQSA
ncbi:hypothetical protein [Neobacillus sp. DY30]|uniref:hypothetical protein n=1 Tax=Neobacillus sp. DY30 TaxID=3047871 RepID=UPI0024C01BD6|nr:hypothetical protein [Neobacillus sp. DY30]WHY02981.1 hypothetical protein QNH29_12495 [Neobacillus sp. DY30]